ncbi:MAG: hypothetical protein ISS11_00900 [Candidatus Marinimicrobia bacterium]|nr:hypothetical protein [Candidatus Neomarinimicrobiota bacterium]
MPFIISADYDGLLCASFLHHYLGWKLEGFYNLQNLWVSQAGIENRNDIVWVDLNILPKQGRAIGGHIVSFNGEIPKGFESSCNPNILAGLTSKDFNYKYPFSTILFLLWINNIHIEKNLLARMLILHSDSVWLKLQNFIDNVEIWKTRMPDYEWNWLFKNVHTKTFEKRIDQILYPELKSIGAISGFSKLTSKHLNIKSRQFQFNPDWDEDVVLKLLHLFANSLKWTPPAIPNISKRIEGLRNKVSVSKVHKIGLNTFLNQNKVFSYAVPSPRIFNYTTFGFVNKSPMTKEKL